LWGIFKLEERQLIRLPAYSKTDVQPCTSLYFGFASGGRRPSEIAVAALRAIGPGQYVCRLEYSKTQQTGSSATSTPGKPILSVAGAALAAWLEASQLSECPLFRRLWKTTLGPGPNGEVVAGIVQRRARLAGLRGDFGGHNSLGSDFLTEGGRQGIALHVLMAMTKHRLMASVNGHIPAGGATDISARPPA
jgi:hypothetical protein